MYLPKLFTYFLCFFFKIYAPMRSACISSNYSMATCLTLAQ